MKNTRTFLKLCFFTFSLIFISCRTPTKINGGVVSAMPYASEVGVKILEKGGNAFDAMVATNFALAVVYPVAGNITGGGFFVYRNADGSSGTLDYREQAPEKAHKDLYLDEAGNVIQDKSTVGGLAVGVPGTVAGTLEIHQKLGTMPMHELIQPAIYLAENGYAVTEKQARSFNTYREQFIEVNGADTFYAHEFKAGDILKNPPLAKVLREIATNGIEGFNSGWVAEAMVSGVQKSGGILTQKDLVNYKPKWRDPLTFYYKDLKVISMGLPSSGGICLNQMMKMIEPYDIQGMGHNSQKSIQLMIEAERRSYADRSEFLGDPDFVKVPLNILLDSVYISSKMNNFDWNRATPSSEIKPGESYFFESDETTHFSILDDQGNAVSVTTTLNGAFGSKVFIDELGVFMNNEMDDFSSKPGVPNMFGLIGNLANAIEPKKRMLSSMTPTIIEKKGELFLILGSPGGSTIITSVFQTILNVYEHKLSIQQSVDASRFHHQWLPDSITFEPNKFDPKLLHNLNDIGYNSEEKKSKIIGKVDAILVDDDGIITLGADYRGDDTAKAY
tara:strand:- start:1214 stop:2893 length:1680 start_codon:yes stop_codon:yes gene_type:complete